MGDDETKRIILARRARFLAAALASASAVTAANACAPQPCLEPVPPPPNDAATTDGGAVDAARADGGEPQPCLTIAPDAEPQPCLAPPPADPDGGK